MKSIALHFLRWNDSAIWLNELVSLRTVTSCSIHFNPPSIQFQRVELIERLNWMNHSVSLRSIAVKSINPFIAALQWMDVIWFHRPFHCAGRLNSFHSRPLRPFHFMLIPLTAQFAFHRFIYASIRYTHSLFTMFIHSFGNFISLHSLLNSSLIYFITSSLLHFIH